MRARTYDLQLASNFGTQTCRPAAGETQLRRADPRLYKSQPCAVHTPASDAACWPGRAPLDRCNAYLCAGARCSQFPVSSIRCRSRLSQRPWCKRFAHRHGVAIAIAATLMSRHAHAQCSSKRLGARRVHDFLPWCLKQWSLPRQVVTWPLVLDAVRAAFVAAADGTSCPPTRALRKNRRHAMLPRTVSGRSHAVFPAARSFVSAAHATRAVERQPLAVLLEISSKSRLWQAAATCFQWSSAAAQRR